MGRRGPSLTALLGLLAVAGYQNRDKISDLVGRMQSTGKSGQPGGMTDQVKNLMGGSPGGSGLSSAISEIMGMFRGTPQEAPAESWVAKGPNAPIQPAALADVIGEDTLTELAQKTGMSRSALLSALATKLPEAVDGMTPHGRLPTDDEAQGYV